MADDVIGKDLGVDGGVRINLGETTTGGDAMIKSFKGKFAFLSNFYYSNGTTIEHLFQASKTFDKYYRREILTAKSPNEARKLGRRVPIRTDWETVKVDVMQAFLYHKFSDPEMKGLLIATGDEILVEGNHWHDNFWGDCYCKNCCNVPGYNTLGKLLMKVRSDLKG